MNNRIIVGILSLIVIILILILVNCCWRISYHNWFPSEVHLEEKDIGEP